jgi:hypothetical protein
LIHQLCYKNLTHVLLIQQCNTNVLIYVVVNFTITTWYYIQLKQNTFFNQGKGTNSTITI